MRKEHYVTALKVAFIVGTILNLINNYDVVCGQAMSFKSALKILFTYSVPFCVSLYSSWMIIKNNTHEK